MQPQLRLFRTLQGLVWHSQRRTGRPCRLCSLKDRNALMRATLTTAHLVRGFVTRFSGSMPHRCSVHGVNWAVSATESALGRVLGLNMSMKCRLRRYDHRCCPIQYIVTTLWLRAGSESRPTQSSKTEGTKSGVTWLQRKVGLTSPKPQRRLRGHSDRIKLLFEKAELSVEQTKVSSQQQHEHTHHYHDPTCA